MNAFRTLTAAALVAAVGGAAWFGCKKKPAQKAVRTVKAEIGPIEATVEATGSVAPLNRVEIKPPIAGRIERLLVDEGARVKEGQILAWMSSSDRAAILDAARAKGPEELKHWEDAYKATPIIAPLSGVIILNNVVVGQTVDPSVVIYAMSDKLIVIGQVDESDIGRVHIGMPARITLDAYPNRATDGKVFDILYEGKNVSNVITYGVKVSANKTPDFFRSQMTANISFIVKRKEDALLIPAVAVKETSDGLKQVSVLGPGGVPMTKEVKTGIETDEKVEVVEGLSEGDKVVLASAKYVPQQPPATSPLTMGGRPGSANFGQAPKPRKSTPSP